jgi:peroxiredoxin
VAEHFAEEPFTLVGVSVADTAPVDVKAYAERYELPYRIGFDIDSRILRTFKVFAIPTQFFIDPNGVIIHVVNGPVDEQGAIALIESLLPD